MLDASRGPRAALAAAVVLLACGGGGGSTNAITGITLNGGSNVVAGFPRPITATVTGTGTFNNAVTFTIVSGGGVLRVLGPQAVNYIAPTTTGSATIKATAQGDPSQTAQVTLNITAPQAPILDPSGHWSGLFEHVSQITADFTLTAQGYAVQISHTQDNTCIGPKGAQATGMAGVSGSDIFFEANAPSGGVLTFAGTVSTPPDRLLLSATGGSGVCNGVTGTADLGR